MYDAVNATNIPRSATMVAGYVDQIKIPMWSPSDWALFPNATKVQIVKKATSNFGHVLDVEEGDATPAEAPAWVTNRRKAGAKPTVYCNYSTWAAVRAAFDAAGVDEPYYWIAKYDGVDVIPDTWLSLGCVAKQYLNTAGYDRSVVVDFWDGVDPVPTASFHNLKEDDMGLVPFPFPPSTARQYHHLTVETRSKSAVVGDLWFAVSSGYQDMTDFHLYFNHVEAPIVVPTITKDTRKWWPVPDGCESISWDYVCTGPSGAAVTISAR